MKFINEETGMGYWGVHQNMKSSIRYTKAMTDSL